MHCLNRMCHAQTARTKSTLPVLESASRALLLSGTPALSKPAELFPQMRGLLPAAKLTYTQLAERYCVPTRWDRYAGCQNQTELNSLLVRALIARMCRQKTYMQTFTLMRLHMWLEGASGRW